MQHLAHFVKQKNEKFVLELFEIKAMSTKANKKTILVTGGAGFIGSHIVDNLLKSKKWEKVVVIDNLILPVEGNDKKVNIRHNLDNEKLNFYEVDLQDKNKVYEIFTSHRPSIVVHVAAVADARNAVVEPQKYVDNNVTATLNLLEACKDFSVEKLIFFSSSSVYGNNSEAPFKENMITDFPISPYGATKKAGEILAFTYHHNFGLPVHVFRIFNAYGPRMRPNLVLYKWVSSILKGEQIQISGNGERKRDYTYVGDIVDAVNKSIPKVKGFEIFNIGNSKPVALKDLLTVTEKVLQCKAKVISTTPHKSSVEETHADTKYAKKIIGWKPATPFEKGIQKFVQWYKQKS
jgi:UDP-glucuronate 4-epimerase